MTKQSSEPRLFVVGYPRIPNEGGDWRMHGPWRDLKDTFPDARVFMDPLTCNATVTFACEDDLHYALKQRRRWRYTERDRYYDVHATEKPRAIGLLTLRGKIPRYAIKELKEKLGIPDLPWAHICFKEDEILIYFNEGAEPEYAAAKDIRSVEIEGYTFDVRVSHDFESEMLVESSSNSRRREGPNEGSWRKPYPGSPTDHRRSSDLAPYSRNRGNDSGGTIGKMRSSHSSSELANNTDRASLTFVFKPSRKEPSLGGFSGVPPGSSASSWRHSSSAAAFRQDSSATSHSPLSPSSSAPARLREDFEQYKRQSVAQMRELNARIDTLRVERDEAEAAKCRLERKLKLFEDLYHDELLEKQVYRNHVYDVRRALGGLLDRLPSSSKDDEIMDDKEPEPYQQQPQEPQPPPPPPPPPPQQQEGPEPEPVPQNNTAARAV